MDNAQPLDRFIKIKSVPDETPDDVIGHNVRGRAPSQEDTEGHFVKVKAAPDDDTDGHFQKGTIAPEEDDTEGHRFGPV